MMSIKKVDDVLIQLTKIIYSRLRKSNILRRYDDEEFIILLTNTNLIGSKTVAENLRKIVENTAIQTCTDKLHITISISVASFRGIEELNLYTNQRTRVKPSFLYSTW
jgi:diguanylate cyclase (GGDEF)-like protein